MNDGKQENNQTSQAKDSEKEAQAASQKPELIDEEPLELNVEIKGDGAQSADETTIESLLQQLETVSLENREINDKLLRTMADMENLRRRKDREIADKEKYAITSFAKEVLNVADNIQRAIESVPEEAIEEDPPLKALLEGVQMTERELNNAMEKYGISKIDSDGELFDPNIHQAMFEVEDPEKPAGTIVQVIQAGYQIGDRILRPAMVGVSKGGAKVAKSDAAEAEKPEEEAKEEKAADVKETDIAEEVKDEKSENGVGGKVDKSA